jgi:hypothetical protein
MSFLNGAVSLVVYLQKLSMYATRVTRMGEFLSVFENRRNGPNFWATLFNVKRYASILTKFVLGYVLGDFFHKLIWSPWPLPTFGTGEVPFVLCTHTWSYKSLLAHFHSAFSANGEKCKRNFFWKRKKCLPRLMHISLANIGTSRAWFWILNDLSFRFGNICIKLLPFQRFKETWLVFWHSYTQKSAKINYERYKMLPAKEDTHDRQH